MAQANVTSNMFEPQVFQAMVDALEPARGLKLYNSVRKDTTPLPYATWTIKQGRNSTLAEYNVPNSKANLIDRQAGVGEGQASLAYMREGDYFTPTATMFLKDAEAGNVNAVKPAEQLVADQVATANDRINNRIEWSLWQAAQGGFEYKGSNTGTLQVDYHLADSHKVVLAAPEQWDNSTNPSLDSMISVIRSMNDLIRRDGGVEVGSVYGTRATLDLFVTAITKAAVGYSPVNLTDAMLNEFYATGRITGLMGSDAWEVVDQYYDVRNADGTYTTKSYIPHGTLLFGNFTVNNPLKYTVGPSADFDAPRGHIGRFAKNWTERDPSGRAFLVEEMGLPVLDRPGQFSRVKVASDAWAAKQSWQS